MRKLREVTFLDRYSHTDYYIPTEIIRYSNRSKMRTENIAEHSFYVAFYVILVGNDYNIKPEIINKACTLAVLHDYPEIYTLDLAHDFKYSHPDVKATFSKAEKDFISQYLPNIKHYFDDLDQDTPESLLVHIGDALSVLLYTNRELSIWNDNHDMKVISNEIRVRLTELFAKLDEYIQKGNIVNGK